MAMYYLFVICLLFYFSATLEDKTGESGVMSVSKLDNSTAAEKASGIAAAIAAPGGSVEDTGGNRAQNGTAAHDVPSADELTAENLSKYLQRTSAISCEELDALIRALHRLREKLVGDCGRIEQGIIEFTTLNQSVLKLTRVVSDGVDHVQAPSRAE
jgi:hypothetical protein